MSQYDMQSEDGWAAAEQWFMRVLAGALFIAAVISIFFPAFQTNTNSNLVFGINIAVTIILGIGSLWTLWYSSEIERMYQLIDGFKENGSGRTYAVAAMQALVGLLFASEFSNGRITLALLGFIMIASAAFFIWRAQQISKHRY